MIRREGWGGPSEPIGSVMPGPATSVTAHHAYPHRVPAGGSIKAELEEIRAIQRFHGAKWLGVGYNFLITLNGTVYEGRGWGRVGAHAGTKEGNRTSIGVAFLIHGGIEVPNAAALVAFRHLRLEGVRDGHLTADHTLKLHRDWLQTDCPGDVAAAAFRALPPLTPGTRVLKRGMSGEDVRELQGLLGLKPLHVTGYFGVETLGAVRHYQQMHGLDVDGIAGEKTMAKLRAR